MKIVLASDHGGLELKDKLVKRFSADGRDVEDLGTHGTDSVDYPDFAVKAAKKVVAGEGDVRGILVCGTGIGISIAANKVDGIRCAKINSVEEGKLASEHNYANMIALGGRTTDVETAYAAAIAWLETPNGGERHLRRVRKIMDIEK